MKAYFEKYINVIITFWVAAFVARAFEAGMLFFTFGNENGMLLSEAAGFAIDIVYGNAFLLLLFPLFMLITRKSLKTAYTISLTILALLTIAHILLLQYFFNQHKPLDTLLFEYSKEEILFTVGTADVSVANIVISVLAALILPAVAYLLVRKTKKPKACTVIALATLPAAIVLMLSGATFHNDYVTNKSLYFYKKALTYSASTKTYCHEVSQQDIDDFHQLFPNRNFLSDEYPLLHEFATDDSLGSYFGDFERKPNIVILIVEGLNDDFVHDFHGLNIMPNLRTLMEKSLYWDHCLTLGERSFAVVPSLLGSLPYGKNGFTLLERLPRHPTLTSILKANGYQTDFFYGQGSWFHRKNIFFKRNNIDLICDDAVYADKYEKIVVGKDNYFWGYNDQDLFNQSLEVIDTLDEKPRLDIYFTGSTHSPFRIPEPEKYDLRLAELCQNLDKDTDRKFYRHYNDNARTLLFFDDALWEFLEKYSQRADFQNTIFVITGDHPMSEIPPSNSLKRYHVPLIIFSPQLKNPARFMNHVSHLDFFETMMAFMEKYGVERPMTSPAFGGDLFVNNDHFAFMNEPRNVVDFYSDGYYISEDCLYKVDNNFGIRKLNDSEKHKALRQRLEIVRKMSEYTSLENRIIPADNYCKVLKQSLICDLDHSDDMEFDAVFTSFISKIDVSGYDTLMMDISFDYKGPSENCVVCELSDENGENLLYDRYFVSTEDGAFATYKQIPVARKVGKTYAKFYFYNPKEGNCQISSLNGALTGSSCKETQ